MDEQRVKLTVLGITFSQVQAGAYALILSEEGGNRRVPIIIGTPEAQSIAIFLEGLHPPRPLTHELFLSFSKALNVSMKEIYIYKFEEGVFFSELRFTQGDKTITIDSRTSDAIALAVRSGAPIFTNENIMKEAGIIMEDDFPEELETEIEPRKPQHSYDSMSLEELEKALNEAIGMEDYEKASKIRDLINKKKQNLS
ncbi:MAG: bifunctional nuclease family protein [Dysgonamonadaceae bacterium]|jgi:bifunctional DNase/RNase|nr:bifunctional nuclease family protein [Dysgonamonadaceae bacterium]